MKRPGLRGAFIWHPCWWHPCWPRPQANGSPRTGWSDSGHILPPPDWRDCGSAPPTPAGRPMHLSPGRSEADMKIAVKGFGIASALAAVMAGNAYAFPTFDNDKICGGSNFYTCATLTTSYDHSNSTLTIEIQNTGELGGAFRQVAVGNLPEGVTVVSGTEDHPSDAWAISTDINDLNGDGDGGFVYQGYESQGNPNDNFINPDGTTYEFTLTFSRDLTDEEVA